MRSRGAGISCCGHIARWADVEKLRGETRKHDGAFERGLFTIDRELNVVVNPGQQCRWVRENVTPHSGKKIRRPVLPPTAEILAWHWKRHGFEFGSMGSSVK
jgi:hypothetical protein